jgi:transposase
MPISHEERRQLRYKVADMILNQGRTIQDTAQELNLGYNYVKGMLNRARKEFPDLAGKRAQYQPRQAKPYSPPERYLSVDWDQSDAYIAQKLGVVREAVRLIRNKLGKPQSKFYRTRIKRQVAAEYFAKFPGKYIKADYEKFNQESGMTLVPHAWRAAAQLAGKELIHPFSELNCESIKVYFSIPQDPDGCWTWTGKTHLIGGHPFATIKDDYFYRQVWKLYNGEISEGYCVRRSCNNYLCGNPKHLILMEIAEKMRLMRAAIGVAR